MSAVGNDGFTDCNYVCNPENDMSWSCKTYCPDFKFITSTTTLTTTELVYVNVTENQDVETNWIVYLCIAAVLFTITLVICCFNKNRITACFKACLDKHLQLPTQVQATANDVEAESGGRNGADEDGAALLSVRSENSGSGNVRDNSSDSGVSLANTTAVLPCDDRNAAVGDEQNWQPENNQQDDWLESLEENSNDSNDETAPKEVGELACLAIGQSSSFVMNVMAFDPSADATTAKETALDDSEEGEHVNDVLNRSDDDIDVAFASGNDPDIGEDGISGLRDGSDPDDLDLSCGESSEEDDDLEEEDSSDDDDDSYSETSNDRLINNTDKKEITVSNKNGIVRVVTEINLREH